MIAWDSALQICRFALYLTVAFFVFYRLVLRHNMCIFIPVSAVFTMHTDDRFSNGCRNVIDLIALRANGIKFPMDVFCHDLHLP